MSIEFPELNMYQNQQFRSRNMKPFLCPGFKIRWYAQGVPIERCRCKEIIRMPCHPGKERNYPCCLAQVVAADGDLFDTAKQQEAFDRFVKAASNKPDGEGPGTINEHNNALSEKIKLMLAC